MTAADEIRQAAATIRDTVSTFGRLHDGYAEQWRRDATSVGAPWTALMAPTVAEPLAAWLEHAADLHTQHQADGADWCRYCAERWVCPDLTKALAVASAITGGAR